MIAKRTKLGIVNWKFMRTHIVIMYPVTDGYTQVGIRTEIVTES